MQIEPQRLDLQAQNRASEARIVSDVDDSLSYQLVDGFRAPMALKLDPENR